MSYVDPGLQSLFMLLRQAGIPVGLEEIRRLGTVFATAPELDEDGLRRVIESVCVKSVEQRRMFRHVYDRWLAVAEKQLASAEQRFKTQHEPSRRKTTGISARLAKAALPPAPGAIAGDAPADSGEKSENVLPAPVLAAKTMPGLDELRGGLRIPVQPQATGEADTSLPLRPEDAQARDVISPGPPPAHPRHALRNVLVAGVLLTMLVLGLRGVEWLGIGGTPGMELDAGPHADAGAVIKIVPEGTRLRTYRPEIEVLQSPEPRLDLFGIGAVALALGLGAWLLLSRTRGRWLPSVPRARPVPGAVALARGAVNSPGNTLFLDSQDEEILVWGVGQFVSDELSQALDIDRTVHETAAAYGRAVLRYEAARYNREVWLWVDESMDSPVARHLARDLERTLRSSGLPVTVSYFWGVPAQLRSGEGVVTVDEMESRRESAAVAVLTDGRLMHTAHRALDRAPALHELLRNLSFWPRVTFIDFGRGRLGPIVEAHGLRAISPQDAPAALSDLAEAQERPSYARLVGDARVWAAACALSSRPVDDPTALKLRQMLGLTVSPWAIETLREHADHRAGGLSWSGRNRADLMAWLLDAEELPEKGLPPPDSLLARIVAAWDRLLVERERAQRAGNPAWDGSAEQDALRVERAFVHVWDRPDEAASTLYELFHGPLHAAIRDRLSELAPRECADHADSIPLPWALRHQRRETQVMLTEMGLGAKAGLDGRRSLPRPGRLMLALGLCAGMLAGGSYALIEARVARETAMPERIEHRLEGPKPVFLEVVPASEQPARWRVSAYTPWSPARIEKELLPGQRYRLYAEPAPIECVEPGQLGRMLRCCRSSDAVVPRKGFTDRWSFVVLPEAPDGQDAKASEDIEILANRLLCSGTADGVFLVAPGQGMPDWSAWGGSDPARSQLLVVSDAVPATLAQYTGQAVVLATDTLRALFDLVDFEDTQSLAQRKPRLEPLHGDPAAFLVQGLGECGKEGQPCCWPEANLDHCDLGLICESGRCVQQRVCEPGTARCEGPQLLATCNAAGTDWEQTRCAADQECQDDRCVTVERQCTPGAAVCSVDGTDVIACEDQSRRPVRRSCAPGTLCHAGECHEIESAAVTFDVRLPEAMSRLPRAALVCSVNGEVTRWLLEDAPPGLRLVHRTITVPFLPQHPRDPLEIACGLEPPRQRDRAHGRKHEWTRASEGRHRMRIPGVFGLDVVYTIRIHLTAPDSGATPQREQRFRNRPARPADSRDKDARQGAERQPTQQRGPQ